MVEERARRRNLACLVIQLGQLPPRGGEQVTEFGFQFVPRGGERLVAGLATGWDMRQARRVEPVDRGDAPDPRLTPAGQFVPTRRGLDEVSAAMRPTPGEGHAAVEHAGQLPVRGQAVDDEDLLAHDAEHLEGRLGAARGIDVEVHRVGRDRDPQPGARGAAGLRERLDAPARLLGVADRRAVLAIQDGPGQRPEQRRQPRQATGERADRDGQPPARPPRRHPVQGPMARETLEQHARPHADAVGRAPEQPVRRRRGHFPRRVPAVGAPTPAGAHDAPLVGLHLDLDERGGLLAVDTGYGAPQPPHAPPTGAGRLRCVPRARAAECVHARALRTGRLPPLALLPVQRPGQHRPAGTKVCHLGVQLLDACRHPGPLLRLRPCLPPQSGVLEAQRADRGLARANLPPRGRVLAAEGGIAAP